VQVRWRIPARRDLEVEHRRMADLDAVPAVVHRDRTRSAGQPPRDCRSPGRRPYGRGEEFAGKEMQG